MTSPPATAAGAPAARGPSRRNVTAMLTGHGGRAVLQGLYFLVVARALGADGFGLLSAVLALVALVLPFASLGAVHLMIRAVVREPGSAAGHFASAAWVTGVGGALAAVLVTGLAAVVLDADLPLAVVAALAVADLVGNLLAEVAAGVYTATERMRRTAAIQLAFTGLRLFAALVLLTAPTAFTLAAWALAYAVASLLGAAVLLVVVRRDVGPAPARPLAYVRQWRDGVQFSIGLAAQAVYNDVDKVALERFAGAGATGAYTAAYRVVDMAFTPARAVLAAAYPRFFAAGASGLPGALAVTRGLAVPGVAFGLFAALALALGAPLLPVLLGPSYAGSVEVLRALAVLPLLKVAHYLAADTLTGAGHQGVRSAWQVGVAVVNVVLCLLLVPALGVGGAVVASLACDGLLAVGLWAVVLRRRRA